MRKFFISLFLFSLSVQLSAQIRLFNSDKILYAELEMDLSYFRAHREDLREKGLPARLRLNGKSFKVEVLSRGHGSMFNQHPPFKLVLIKII